ncbi:MAG TPA: hypothetical protein VF631_03625 [Allosphingosinicella sp.]|jgi:hypothetical protein|uniref:hypothetical protein n=1 Tax=Allosphingosinicella sp. TaxID=2823234 RepID=UPI002F2AB83C
MSAAAAVALLSACSKSTEYFIHKSLKNAGFKRPEARCAVDGVAGQLSRDQLSALRGPLLRYVMLDEPARLMDVDELLAWLRPRVSPEIHHVVSHYATECRVAG